MDPDIAAVSVLPSELGNTDTELSEDSSVRRHIFFKYNWKLKYHDLI